MKKNIPFLAVLLLLAGCTQYSLLEPKRTTIGDAFSVEPQIEWSRQSLGHNEIWTTDGPLLQQVRFVHGLTAGKTLYASAAATVPETWPKLRNQTHPSEIMEFVVDSLTALKANNPRTENLRPFKFGSHEGFRFDYNYNADGLDHNGIAVGAEINGEFSLILYSGTRLHYFEKHLDTFERILGSIQPL